MDKVTPDIFSAVLAFDLQQRKPYCFDKCFNNFNNEISREQ